MKHFLSEISEICKNFGDLSQKNSDFQSEKRRLSQDFISKEYILWHSTVAEVWKFETIKKRCLDEIFEDFKEGVGLFLQVNITVISLPIFVELLTL